MYRRDFLKWVGCTASVILTKGCNAPEAAVASRKKPNIVFMFADDLGYTDLGCFGSSFYETPALDQLSSEGVRFTDAYAYPVCSPSRCALMTGKDPSRTGVTSWIGGPQPQRFHAMHAPWTSNRPVLPAPYTRRMALDEVTLAEAFKQHDYATFFAGKWHLGPEGYWPEDQGFDVNIGGHSAGGPWGGDQYFSPYDNPRMEDGPQGEHLPDRLATETVQFMQANRDRPFFAFLSFYSVHTPLMARADLEEKYTRKRRAQGLETRWGTTEEGVRVRLTQDDPVYAGMVEAMDQAAGKVLNAIKALGLQDNTIVVFYSDNGGMSTSHGHPTSNLALRAGKGWVYEGGIRVPLIVKWPGVSQTGMVCDGLVNCTDFYPTLLEMAGLPPLPEQHLDGHSFAEMIRGKAVTRDPLCMHFPHYSPQFGFPGGIVRDGEWKLVENYETGALELYNLPDDIGETTNLADRYPDKTEAMHQTLIAFRKEVGAKMPTPNPDYEPPQS